MNITVYTITYNEEHMMQFMIDHYRSRFPNCHIVVYDNQSTDKTVEIAKANSCEVRYYNSNGKQDELMLWKTKNSVYKDAKTDWVLVCDTDELLDINEEQLAKEDADGVTVIKTQCWHMVNKENNFDLKSITYGYKGQGNHYINYNKDLLFNKKYVDINYHGPGCHKASPIGRIKDSKLYNILHYNYCNEEFFITRRTAVSLSRLNQRDMSNNWGTEHLLSEETLRAEYKCAKDNSVKIINNMEHFYQNIEGWFNYQSLYKLIVGKLPDNSYIVEIGAWKGASTAYLAVEIVNSGKNIKLHVVDTWKGNENDPANYAYAAELKLNNGDMINVFKHNMKSVQHIVHPLQCFSVDAAKLYPDKTLDFVFLDGTPEYGAVREDILAWLPKIKSGGWIGGHDYNFDILRGVTVAVKEIFGGKVITVPGTFDPNCPNNQKIGFNADSWLVQLD